MSEFLSITEAAEALHTTPREVSDLLYRRRVSLEHFPRIGFRRVVPKNRLPELREALRQLAEKRGRRKQTA